MNDEAVAQWGRGRGVAVASKNEQANCKPILLFSKIFEELIIQLLNKSEIILMNMSFWFEQFIRYCVRDKEGSVRKDLSETQFCNLKNRRNLDLKFSHVG